MDKLPDSLGDGRQLRKTDLHALETGVRLGICGWTKGRFMSGAPACVTPNASIIIYEAIGTSDWGLVGTASCTVATLEELETDLAVIPVLAIPGAVTRMVVSVIVGTNFVLREHVVGI